MGDSEERRTLRCLPARKAPVHLATRTRLGRTPIVFVTVCTDQRKPLLARPEVHDLLLRSWAAADQWAVGQYVLMPDHVHLFCTPRAESCSLGRWVQYWKAVASRQWPWRNERPVWQRSFWDRQLRQGERYLEKWYYVRENPVRKGFAPTAEAWSYQGAMHVLPWFD